MLEVDYSAARAGVGDRYPLAKPLNGNPGAGRNVPLPKAELAQMGLSVGARMTRVDQWSRIDACFDTTASVP